jgi:tRNA (guanine26-N2/guanine27-N2)-dimethyltransferase
MLEWVRQRAPLKNQPKKLSAGLAIISKTHVDGLFISESVNKATDPPSISSEKDQTVQPNGDGNVVTETTTEEPAPFSYLGADFPVILDEELGKDRERGKLVRYQLAPRENWGPMSRAK